MYGIIFFVGGRSAVPEMLKNTALHRTDNLGRVPGKGNGHSRHHGAQTKSGTKPTSYLIDTKGSSLENKAAGPWTLRLTTNQRGC